MFVRVQGLGPQDREGAIPKSEGFGIRIMRMSWLVTLYSKRAPMRKTLDVQNMPTAFSSTS